MGLTMKEKQAVTKQLALNYKRAGKKEKGKILDTVIELAGYNRSYAARGLRQRVKPKVLGRLPTGSVQITLLWVQNPSNRRTLRLPAVVLIAHSVLGKPRAADDIASLGLTTLLLLLQFATRR